MKYNKVEKINLNSLADYGALKKLAAALWQRDSSYHGAAVMVGAGFSRSGALTGELNKKLPLWYDLSKILSEELGGSSSFDPLRQAEEYCAQFGKQALHDLIKKEVNDSAWVPGDLYKHLLELPWSEVLTTNWDTLLERSSKDVHHPVYSVALKQEDLSSARSPRIVKLHGTINITEDLIFTQEDYRKYPQRHAAFVNFARQVFIENELCLLGFSGDDPNFLQWAGWVRDQLTMHSRRIYLVGALNLTVAKRKYLESINVCPIDLSILVAEYDDHDSKHYEATKIFLQALQELRPNPVWEWSPTRLHQSDFTSEEHEKSIREPDYAAILLEKQLSTLKADRDSFPGWLVCPTRQRWDLQNQISHPYPTTENLSKMAPASRENLLYEIAWQHGVTYCPISPWLSEELFRICDPSEPCALTKRQQMEVALLLLKNTRWFDEEDYPGVSLKTTEILKNNKKYWQESADELAFHQAGVARDNFDYASLEKLANKISENDPVWKLRKASLLSEIGQFVKVEELIAEAYKELLLQYRNDRNSIYVFSRLAWAHWLLRGSEIFKARLTQFPAIYQESKCSPWDHIQNLQDQISKAIDRQYKKQGIEPSFEPGHYKDKSNSVIFNNELHPLLLLDGIACATGMPLRLRGVGFLVEQASKLSELDGIDDRHRFSLAIRSANSDTSDTLKKVFSRTKVACIQEIDVNYLLENCILAINYWSLKISGLDQDLSRYAVERLRIFIEVLARLSVRAKPEQAKRIFKLACELGGKAEFHHIWLTTALGHLISYSMSSIPDSEHHELLSDALFFPLSRETRLKDHYEWPNPVIEFPGERDGDTALGRRIGEIIDGIAPCSVLSAPALLRLLPLLKNEFLTGDEKERIAEKLWGLVPDYQNLPETGLLKSSLLKLPSKNPSAVKLLVRKYLFQSDGNKVFNLEILRSITNAALEGAYKELPTQDEAINYFGRLVEWRVSVAPKDPFGFSNNSEEMIGKQIGLVLAKSIVPSLPSQALNDENFLKLSKFYCDVESPGALMAFSYFAAENNKFEDQVEKYIRQGLQEQNSAKVGNASYALLTWRELNSSPATSRLILRLIYTVGSSRTSGLAALLWTINQLLNKGYISDGDTDNLIEILPVIFDSSDYQSISHTSREAVTVSLVRAACVRLARDILNFRKCENSELIRIVDVSKTDALPEVRFAEMNNE